MSAIFDIETDENGYDLKAHVVLIGSDLLVAIWGGDRPHIGAVSFGMPHPSLKDPSTISETASTFCYPGHKEDVITRSVSLKLTSQLNTHVVVSAGAHWKTIDKKGIEKVIKNSEILADLILARIKPHF